MYRKPKQTAAEVNFQDMPEALDDTQIEDLVSEFAGILEIVPGTISCMYSMRCGHHEWMMLCTSAVMQHPITAAILHECIKPR